MAEGMEHFTVLFALFLTHHYTSSASFSYIPPLSPAEYPVEWRHHRLGHGLWWLWLHFVPGGAAWHAKTTPLHQAASEQISQWPWGTHSHTVKYSTQWYIKSPCNHYIVNFCLSLLQLHQYQFYSTGLLSTHDPFYEQQRHLLGPKKKKIKDEKKFKGKDKKRHV